MSDVSGIPYMGTMGMGNFFAPPFSSNPQMSAGQISSTYMPEIANNQNVVNNLFNTPGGGGGFGRATDYYSQLGANYLAQVPSSWENPYAHGAIVPQSLRVEGGNYADGGGGGIFNQGAINNFMTEGGGFNFPSSGGAPAINWDTIFQSAGGGLGGSPRLGLDDVQTWAGNWNTPQSSAFDVSGGAGMFGGLAGGMGGAYQGQNNQIDWTKLSQPQQPQPQQPPYTSGIEPDQTGGQTLDAPMAGAPSSTMDWSTLFGDSGNMSMPGGLNSPMTAQAPAYDYGSLYGKGTEGAAQPAPDGTRTYDIAPMFEGGGGGGFGTGGAETSQLFGAQQGSLGGNIFDYTMQPPETQDSRQRPAQALADEARARLADIIGSPETAKAVEAGPGGRTAESAREAGGPVLPDTELSAEAREGVPLPRPRPEAAGTGALPPESPATRLYPGADAPRPPGLVPRLGTDYRGRDVTMVEQRLRRAVEGGASFLPPGYSIQPTSGYQGRETSQGFHSRQRAEDFRIIGPDGAIPNSGHDYSGMYTQLARGVKTWLAQNDPTLDRDMRWGGAFETSTGSGRGDTMHFDTGARTGAAQGNLNPNSRWTTLQPLTEAEQNQMPAYIPLLGANQVPIEGRVPAGTGSSYSANPARFADTELFAAAGATPGGTGATAPSYWNIPKEGTPGWNKEVYEPAFGGFVMRRPEDQTTGGASHYADFPRTGNIEDRRTEQALSPDQLAAGRVRGFNYDAGPEPAAGPLSGAAGLGNLPIPRGGETTASAARPQRFTGEGGTEDLWGDVPVFDTGGADFTERFPDSSVFAPTPEASRDALARLTFNGFSPSPEPRSGGVGPPVSMTPEHMRTMEEIESHQNPRLHDPGSSYKGLYQLSDSEFRKYGGAGSIFNAEQNTKAATAKMYAEGQRAQDILGRALTPVEQYMVHQQGLAGTLSHLANPDQPAWKSFQQASGWNEARAKTAIWGNLSDAQQAQFGSVNNITSRDFINLWNTMYYRKMVESGLSPGGLSDLPR